MEKSVVLFAPGRVELLGNHTDYNEGLALAAAINLGVTVRAEKLDPFDIGGLRLRVTSNLPSGSGLSISAAFEIATAVAALEPPNQSSGLHELIGAEKILKQFV